MRLDPIESRGDSTASGKCPGGAPGKLAGCKPFGIGWDEHFRRVDPRQQVFVGGKNSGSA